MTAPVSTPVHRGPRVPLRITLVALLVVTVAVGLAATGGAATSLLRRSRPERRTRRRWPG